MGKTPPSTNMADKISLPDEASACLSVLQGLFVMPLPHLFQTQAQEEPCASRSPRLLTATRLAERDNALATDDICEGHTNYCGGMTAVQIISNVCPPLRGMSRRGIYTLAFFFFFFYEIDVINPKIQIKHVNILFRVPTIRENLEILGTFKV